MHACNVIIEACAGNSFANYPIGQYTYRFYTKLKTTKKKIIKYSKLYTMYMLAAISEIRH